MKQDRREFLRKSLKVGTIAGGLYSTNLLASTQEATQANSNGVVVGKSNKKEVLYHKTKMWEHFYKIVY